LIGNLPQAWTHVSLGNSATTLSTVTHRTARERAAACQARARRRTRRSCECLDPRAGRLHYLPSGDGGDVDAEATTQLRAQCRRNRSRSLPRPFAATRGHRVPRMRRVSTSERTTGVLLLDGCERLAHAGETPALDERQSSRGQRHQRPYRQGERGV
jgi:hypothetical protein